MTDGMSAADLAAITNSNGEGWNSSWFIWILLIFAMFGGNGFWGNGNQQYATSADVQRSTDNQNVMQRFDTLTQNQANNAYDNGILIKDAQYTNLQNVSAINSNMTNGFNSVATQLCAGFSGVNSNINDIGYQIQSTSCATNRNIDSVKFENAQNTCAITNAIHQEGELTRGLIQANVVQDLRDRLEEKDRLYQAANFQISQSAQTSNILDSLGRWVSNPPMPIYTQSYYTTGTTVG